MTTPETPPETEDGMAALTRRLFGDRRPEREPLPEDADAFRAFTRALFTDND